MVEFPVLKSAEFSTPLWTPCAIESSPLFLLGLKFHAATFSNKRFLFALNPLSIFWFLHTPVVCLCNPHPSCISSDNGMGLLAPHTSCHEDIDRNNRRRSLWGIFCLFYRSWVFWVFGWRIWVVGWVRPETLPFWWWNPARFLSLVFLPTQWGCW